MKNLEYCKRQIKLSMLRAQWWLTSAQSGHYKQSGSQRGTDQKSDDGRIVFRDCTDEEKLESCMATALRHIDLAREFSESLAEEEEKLLKEML
jgi:hypothetical protein